VATSGIRGDVPLEVHRDNCEAIDRGDVMKSFDRRQFVRLGAGAAALSAASISGLAMAQTYPSRPVRWVVSYPPGGISDISARLMSQWLSERLGQQFVVETRPGAGGNLGTEAVVRAPADGYTILQVATAAAMNATFYTNLSFNFIRDIAPVVGIMRVPGVVVVHPSFPATTIPEFIAYAKANPGKITMASAGNGTAQHMYGELFKMMAGVDLVHVPYRGGAPSMNDVVAGQVQVTFSVLTESIEHIRANNVRPLAVTTATRWEGLPDVPPVGDFLPGYEGSAWQGVGVPKNTPAAIIDMLNKEMNAGLADPRIKSRLVGLGGTILGGSPADFAALIATDTEKWARVVKGGNIKLD
jgi:tripartite-type tricarboxylate transporter receptor subunit TctC